MTTEHPVIATRQTAGSLLRKMLLHELTIGDGEIGQMDMLSILACAADWLDEAVAKNATTGLTNAERDAVLAAACYFDTRADLRMQGFGSTLRTLLERLK